MRILRLEGGVQPKMKIIIWNCRQGGWRGEKNKESKIKDLKPDIVVVPECEDFGEQIPDGLWFRVDSKEKGIGVFSYSKEYTLEVHEEFFKSDNPYVIPIKVSGKDGKEKFTLFAVWTKDNARADEYIGQLWNAVTQYERLLVGPVVIAGDLNWDMNIEKKYKSNLFTKTIRFLEEKGIKSMYHEYFKEKFGEETQYTEYHSRWKKYYHVDYCFASEDFIKNLEEVKIGEFKDWGKDSDHMPLIVTFK